MTTLSPAVVDWYRSHRENHLWRELWQKHADPYYVWVSEIMLQQTNIATVTPRYANFVQAFPNLESLASATEEKIRPFVQGLGYYRRFRSMSKTAKILAKQKSWPTSYQQWIELPGIGEYTAAALASITLNELHPVWDGNVERLSSRIWRIHKAKSDPKLKEQAYPKWQAIIEEGADRFNDPNYAGDFNQGLMELGQKLCRPRNPDCDRCPLDSACASAKTADFDQYPMPKKKPPTIQVSLALAVPYHAQTGKIGVMTRPKSAQFLRNILGFPTFLAKNQQLQLDCKADERPLKDLIVPNSTAIKAFRHSITNHRIAAEIFEIPAESKIVSDLDMHWVSPAKLEKQLTASLDVKTLRYWQDMQKNQNISPI